MAAAKKKKEAEGTSAKSALIFEMDNVALGARQIRYEVLASILKEQKIELSPILFSRYCLHPSPSAFMASFLKQMAYTASPPKQVIERMMGETVSRLMQKTTVVNDGLIQWIETAVSRGAAVACVSMLPQESADAVAAHLGFERWDIQVYSALPHVDDRSFPRAEHWLRIIKAIDRTPTRSLALVSSMFAAKTALAAMMNVVAVPDEFTEYQDFCGANLVCAELKKVKPSVFFEEISF
ncbi:MAG: hypothetical protein PHI93_04135 [Kiritimatiellae bacterium]|nr:hypothetical protein [Kiritimatiellia bacterium]